MRRVRIHRVHGDSFGRMAGRSVDLGDHPFVVIHGPNESGKSTIAELISWVLAGRRTEHDVGSRFAPMNAEPTRQSVIGARIEGTVDRDPFAVERKFKVKLSNRGGPRPTDDPPAITVGSAVRSATAWAELIGVETGDDYFRRYRITGPYDPDNSINVTQLLEALSIGVDRRVSPRAVLEVLAAQADLLVPATNGRVAAGRAITPIDRALKEANEERARILAEEGRIDALLTTLRDIEEAKDALDDEFIAVTAELGALSTARDLLPARGDLEQSALALSELPTIPEPWSAALAARADADVMIGRLDEADSRCAERSRTLDEARITAGLDPGEVEHLQVDESDVEVAETLDRARSQARAAIESSATRRPTVESERASALRSLADKSSSLDTSIEHLRRFTSMAVDDASFGDPVKNWSDAARAVDEHRPTIDAATRAVEESRTRLYEADAAWLDLGGTGSPEAVLEGTIGPSGPVLDRRSLAWLVAALAAVVAAASFRAWVGIAAAAIVVVAGSAVLRTRRTVDGAPASSDLLTAARRLVEARDEHGVADTALRTARSQLEQLEGMLATRSTHALEVLTEFGFDDVTDVRRAMRLRAERTEVVELVARIGRADTELTALEQSTQQGREALDTATVAVVDMATRLGVARMGASLDAPTVRRLRQVCIAREELESAQGRRDEAQAALRALITDLAPTVDTRQIRAEFDRLSRLADQRSALAAHIADQRRRLESADERVAAILAEDAPNAVVLGARIELVEQRLAGISERSTSLSEERGALNNQLEALRARTDLAATVQAIEQGESEQRRIALEGTSWWLAHRLVADVKLEVETNHQPGLVRRAGEVAEAITAGYWSRLLTDDGRLLVTQQGRQVHQDGLSAGGIDILRLAVRLAVAEAHSEKVGVALPIILDDPTASVDSERAPRLFDVLRDVASSHQIILLTHDEHTVRRALDVGAVGISLERP
ncbi:MAG: AAA family ATPase [Ilumatobacteraceae bacterium]